MRLTLALLTLATSLILVGCGDDGGGRSAAPEVQLPQADRVDSATGKRLGNLRATLADPATGQKIYAFTYDDNNQLWGLKVAGGEVLVKPVYERTQVIYDTLFVWVDRAWAVVSPDGKVGDERFDEVTQQNSPFPYLSMRTTKGDFVIRDRGNAPLIIDLSQCTFEPNTLLYRSKTWTNANLGNIGTQGTIANAMMPMFNYFGYLDLLTAVEPAKKAQLALTYAKFNNLMLQCFYYATDPGYVESRFGSYQNTADHIIDGYAAAIRFNAGADAALDKEARKGRVEAAFVRLSYDRVPMSSEAKTKLAAALNEDLEKLEADPAEKPFVDNYAAALQKLFGG